MENWTFWEADLSLTQAISRFKLKQLALFKTTSLLNFLKSVTLKLCTFCLSKLFILDKLNDLPTKQFSTTCNILSICRDWALLFKSNGKAQFLETINKISLVESLVGFLKRYLYFLSLPKSFASKIWYLLKKILNLENVEISNFLHLSICAISWKQMWQNGHSDDLKMSISKKKTWTNEDWIEAN